MQKYGKSADIPKSKRRFHALRHAIAVHLPGALAPSMVSRRAARGRRAGGWGDAAAARGEKGSYFSYPLAVCAVIASVYAVQQSILNKELTKKAEAARALAQHLQEKGDIAQAELLTHCGGSRGGRRFRQAHVTGRRSNIVSRLDGLHAHPQRLPSQGGDRKEDEAGHGSVR